MGKPESPLAPACLLPLILLQPDTVDHGGQPRLLLGCARKD